MRAWKQVANLPSFPQLLPSLPLPLPFSTPIYTRSHPFTRTCLPFHPRSHKRTRFVPSAPSKMSSTRRSSGSELSSFLEHSSFTASTSTSHGSSSARSIRTSSSKGSPLVNKEKKGKEKGREQEELRGGSRIKVDLNFPREHSSPNGKEATVLMVGGLGTQSVELPIPSVPLFPVKKAHRSFFSDRPTRCQPRCFSLSSLQPPSPLPPRPPPTSGTPNLPPTLLTNPQAASSEL